MSEHLGVAHSSKTGDAKRAERSARLKADLKALSSAKAGGISGICFLDISERLSKLLSCVEAASQVIDLTQANKVHNAVIKLFTKPTIGRGTIVKLTESSIDGIRRLLTAVTRALPHDANSNQRKSNVQLDSFIKRCAGTLCQACAMATSSAAWKNALEYLRDSFSTSSMSFEVLLSEQTLGENYWKIQAGTIDALGLAVKKGDVSALSELSGLFRRHQEMKNKADGFIAQQLSEQASAIPSASQQWIMDQLGLVVEAPAVEYANPAQSPEIRQAAALLMYLFDHQTESGELKDAFERFRALCERHFHLFLRGNVGVAVTFDSRLHESPEAMATDLRLMRPWVEWYVPPDAQVVIRGILE
jgi:hypothetical protein